MTKFNIGDRVQSVFPATAGQLGTIVAKTNTGSWVVAGFTHGSPAPGGFSYSERNLQLIKEQQTASVEQIIKELNQLSAYVRGENSK